MLPSMGRIELLSRAHDREQFDCGSAPLNDYLKQTARQHTERGLSRTFVLVEENAAEPKEILGFFTLNICQLKTDHLPPGLARKLPREISGVKLGRLAVAKDRQRQGIGKMLLVAALRKFQDVFESVGSVGLFVDAKDETSKAYYEGFGFIPLPSNPLQLFLPLDSIQDALSKAS